MKSDVIPINNEKSIKKKKIHLATWDTGFVQINTVFLVLIPYILYVILIISHLVLV